MDTEACRGQKKASDPLELELQAVLSCLAWVLGTRSPVKEARALVTEPSLQALHLRFYVYCRAILNSQVVNQGKWC